MLTFVRSADTRWSISASVRNAVHTSARRPATVETTAVHNKSHAYACAKVQKTQPKRL